jgi:hypothetical protein
MSEVIRTSTSSLCLNGMLRGNLVTFTFSYADVSGEQSASVFKIYQSYLYFSAPFPSLSSFVRLFCFI